MKAEMEDSSQKINKVDGEKDDQGKTANKRNKQPKEDEKIQQKEVEVEEFSRDFDAGSEGRWEKRIKVQK